MLRLILIFILLLSLLLYSAYSLRNFSFKTFVSNVVTKIKLKVDKNIYQIVYTSEGYSPDIIEVPLGAKIAFVNSSDIPMWTASDPHPTHTDFVPFDAGRDYSKNEVYTYQFTKTGTFSFHNHDKSLHRGIIRVIDYENPMPNLDKTLPHQRVIREKMINLLMQNDSNSIYKVIDTIEADGALSNDCHDVAHDIGHKAYEMYGFSGAMTFNDPNRLGHTSVDDICAGGYMHGILEEVFVNQPELKDNPGPVCSAIPENNRDSCFHGVGHGLMFVTKRDTAASLATCRDLADFVAEHRCYEGVWMEMFWGETEHAGADSLRWDIEKPLSRCLEAQETEKPACFLYAHLGYLRAHRYDFNGAVNLCTNSGLNEYYTKFCIKGIGITMMKRVTSNHLERSEDLVKNLDYGRKYAYYEGVIGYARLSNVGENDLVNFCSSLKNDAVVCAAVLREIPQ